jgi:hypothetical protein
VQQASFKIEIPKEFVDVCQDGDEEVRDRLCELYLHNHSLPHPYK